jgi:predicted nucleotidyltransferase
MNLISAETMEAVKNCLIDIYHPEAIYIFGSYAWGTPDEDSDLDLLVVVASSNEKYYSRPIAGRHALWDFDFSKDLVVYTQAEFDARVTNETTLAYKVKHEGKVLYARS